MKKKTKPDKQGVILKGAMFETRYKNYKLAQEVRSKMQIIDERLKK